MQRLISHSVDISQTCMLYQKSVLTLSAFCLQKPLNLFTFCPLHSEVEPLLLDERHIWTSQEGWLVFDLTTTSALWLVSSKQNLSLHMVLEDSFGQSQPYVNPTLMLQCIYHMLIYV